MSERLTPEEIASACELANDPTCSGFNAIAVRRLLSEIAALRAERDEARAALSESYKCRE